MRKYVVIVRTDPHEEGRLGEYVRASSEEFDGYVAAQAFAATLDAKREPLAIDLDPAMAAVTVSNLAAPLAKRADAWEAIALDIEKGGSVWAFDSSDDLDEMVKVCRRMASNIRAKI